MEPNATRTPESRIEVFDTDGRLIGVIHRPIEAVILGPGREKVYLARRAPGAPGADRHPQAA